MRVLHKWQYGFGSYNAILNMSGNELCVAGLTINYK